jgi:glutamine amidotransferase PdxT
VTLRGEYGMRVLENRILRNLFGPERDEFYQQIGLKFEEETSEMLHLEHGFVWC